MELDEYQREQLRTANQAQSFVDRLTTACLGLAGEAGEVCDHVKKWRGQGHCLDRKALANEVADVLWYCSEAAHALGFTLDEVAQMNIAKLRTRFPDGFEVERSINRPAGNGG